ncbi:phospholipid carrier-dependent glycosyltransferase [Frankia sp. CNm7]|uniref:Polyprenol-phosphate-mannose--protein mannosyltransferase n=3 Tax=Frankia nepalensis TaxID=1836974 RepID=A0A937RVB4_9ACTN|nr:phospholipid carrier-dependent glycosyltransferase [Frankia nepalensis]MBL7513325.1 phospholipid carrier-dependent glycosyltransferase [Frankia nepalensis]MBL7517616.1 phospholipid carrier-dependent glycosyltransferase [Frankia nepalensis]MBL7633473.1 phospholipid carrier-dependent glycosyltransferase [Frankia nepalensis]
MMAQPTGADAGPATSVTGRRSGRSDPASPLRDRLCPPMPSDRLAGWLAALGVTLVAGILRFWRLTEPKYIYFDEVYYTRDAWGLMTHGYEVSTQGWAEADKAQCVGAGYVVHPPLGKWFMAASQKLFGYVDCSGAVHGNPELGWRFASAFFGTVAVLVLTRTARRMFRSTVLGCFAGLVFAFDGLQFVQSRIGILDIFLMSLLVMGLACLVADRDYGRAKLADRVTALAERRAGTAEGDGDGDQASTRAAQLDARYGPRLGLRPWRLAAGFFLGAAMGVKWSGLYTLVGFAALAIAWDIGARRTAGATAPVRGALRRDLPAWFGCYVPLPMATFLATWTGWFVTDGGYNRHTEGDGFVGAWKGWWGYQRAILDFHEHLSTPHPAQSAPFSWLVLGRPVPYDYDGPGYGQKTRDGSQVCDAVGGCSREILALGNPAVWWVGTACLVVMIAFWVTRRDWRAALVLVGFGASFLPWLLYPSRTMFFFYALPLLPFLVLGITAAAGLALGPREASDTRRLVGALSVGVYLIAVILLFAYFYPILSGQLIPLSAWRARMWFPGWI